MRDETVTNLNRFVKDAKNYCDSNNIDLKTADTATLDTMANYLWSNAVWWKESTYLTKLTVLKTGLKGTQGTRGNPHHESGILVELYKLA